jgi:hypothetical protein
MHQFSRLFLFSALSKKNNLMSSSVDTSAEHVHGRFVPQKIITSINKVHQAGKTTVSFEFYPARTEAGITNQLAVMEELVWRFRPTFITLTWCDSQN